MKYFLRFSAILIVVVCFAQGDEERSWKAFLDWVKTPAAPDNPAELMKAYAGRLASSGLSEPQVKAQLGIVQKHASQPGGEFTTVLFDKIYASSAPQFNTEPSAFLARAIEGLPPGKALDVAMGQGRNAILLARKGWEVTGYDVSPGGLAAAAAGAAKAGVRIDAVRKSHEEFDFGVARWDLIAMIFPGVSMDDEGFLKRVRASLKPGGVLIVEQFNAPPIEGAKGPPNALFKTFQDFRVLHYEDAVDTSDWGKTKARIGRIVAVKE